MSFSGKPAERKRSARYCAIAGTWPKPSEVRNAMTCWKISRACLRTSSGVVSLASSGPAQRTAPRARAGVILFMDGKNKSRSHGSHGVTRSRDFRDPCDFRDSLPARGRWRMAQDAMHVPRKVTLMREARGQRDLGNRKPVVAQEQLRTLDTTAQHVLVHRQTSRVAEQRLQVRDADARYLGDAGQR